MDIKSALARGEFFRRHAFEFARARYDIKHPLIKCNYLWANGGIERVDRTTNEAASRICHQGNRG